MSASTSTGIFQNGGSVVRASMANLILRIRTMTYDLDVGNYWHTDSEIQDAFDIPEHKTYVHYLPLDPIPTRTPSSTEYLTFFASYYSGQPWEESVELLDGTYATLTPDTSEYNLGVWEFLTEPTLPVVLSGKCYDIFAVAAYVIDLRLAKLWMRYDAKMDDTYFYVQQQKTNLERLRDSYRRRSSIKYGKAQRTDVNNAYGQTSYGSNSAGA